MTPATDGGGVRVRGRRDGVAARAGGLVGQKGVGSPAALRSARVALGAGDLPVDPVVEVERTRTSGKQDGGRQRIAVGRVAGRRAAGDRGRAHRRHPLLLHVGEERRGKEQQNSARGEDDPT